MKKLAPRFSTHSIVRCRTVLFAVAALMAGTAAAEPPTGAERTATVAEDEPAANLVAAADQRPAPAADDAQAHGSDALHAAATDAPATSAPRGDLEAATLSDDELADERAGADLHASENNLSGDVRDNAATNVTTGANTITQGALSNASGIPMVIQNSGNNVLIQNSTILNLQLTK